ncbi:uncharacterized protein TA08415 [Theileria annulata]|uniref:Uncharacterized protein n=1 Tax=Theileria annulata TaxID=5874 RepID=Q4U9N1_THEAN|nr:uncharacterized protein TA08415 [Theileria annulata]CAI76472.1 hypothetical protein TA08415 [Theileria annulata]|eukprot:XP_953097.1 hypothetical protein TA08415 [Theileria annulata]
MFAILFALPICILLDLGKLIVGFFWLILRTVLGIPEPVEERQPTVTKQRVFKFRAVCRLAITEENKLYFRLVRPRRCFMLGERLKIFKRICYAENMYFVHNLNKLMIDSNRKYGSESDTSSDEESVGSLMQIRESLEKSFSNQYLDDSDTLPESDIETINRNEITSEDDLEDLRTFSMNPFDLDESDEEILNMMRKSYDSAENVEEAVRKVKKKKGKIANYISGIYSKRMARKGKYVDEQHLSDYEQDSDENIETGNKIGVIGMLKKVKDQIVMANYKINLYNMRFEKFLNMFSWKNYSVTTIVLFLLILIIMINLFFSIEIIMLAYILYQFKAGYKRGTWERMVLSTTKRHISKAIVELEIFRPFWDLSTHQIQVLSNRIKAFSSIELEINTIREAKDETHLAYIISDQLINGKFARNWKRYRWINNLFRQAPCKQY